MRSFEQEKGGGGHLAISVENGIATVHAMYEDADKYSVEPIASEWGVFYYSEAGDSHTEVFRGSSEEAHAFHSAMGEDFDLHGVEPIAPEWGVFFSTDEGETRTEVFRGNEEEAHAFYDTKTTYVAFTGTEAEAQAWEQARHEESINLLPANLTIAAGAVIILAGLGLGWRRRPEQPADDGSRPQDLVGAGH